jgi:hypothetical protein
MSSVSKRAQEGSQAIKSAVATPLVPDFSLKDYSTFFLAGVFSKSPQSIELITYFIFRCIMLYDHSWSHDP